MLPAIRPTEDHALALTSDKATHRTFSLEDCAADVGQPCIRVTGPCDEIETPGRRPLPPGTRRGSGAGCASVITMPASDLHDPECRDGTCVKVKYLYCPDCGHYSGGDLCPVCEPGQGRWVLLINNSPILDWACHAPNHSLTVFLGRAASLNPPTLVASRDRRMYRAA